MKVHLTEPELLAAFRELDRKEVELPPDLPTPIALYDATSWVVGPRAFLLYRHGAAGQPTGVVFHRNDSGPDVVAMCDWCHAIRGHGNVRLLTVRADKRRRVGVYLCSDLGCVARTNALPSPDDLRERFGAEERRRRTLARIREFVGKRLF